MERLRRLATSATMVGFWGMKQPLVRPEVDSVSKLVCLGNEVGGVDHNSQLLWTYNDNIDISFENYLRSSIIDFQFWKALTIPWRAWGLFMCDSPWQSLIFSPLNSKHFEHVVKSQRIRTSVVFSQSGGHGIISTHQQKQFGTPMHSVRPGRPGRCNAYTPSRMHLNAKHLVIHPPNAYYPLVYILIHTIS